MVNDDKGVDIYKIDTNKKINKKRILILVGCICILLCLILIIKYSIEILNRYTVYKQYETQLQSIIYQEQQIKAEEERKR